MVSTADDSFPFDIDALLASTHKLLRARGATAAADLLLRAEAHVYQSDYDNWNGGTAIWAMRLAVDVEFYATLDSPSAAARCEELTDAISSFFGRYTNDSFSRVVLLPKVTEDAGWRQGRDHIGARAFAPDTTWRKLGEGGFGTVYAIRDESLNMEFALKVFRPSVFNDGEDGRKRFLREAGLLFRLHHEYIARIFDAGTLSNGDPYIKMEYFPGASLQAMLDNRPLSVEETLYIVGRIAGALDHAHARQIIHRDIKPTNILVTQSVDAVRLIDFGLGILVEEAAARDRLTHSSHDFGNAYASPELRDNPKDVDPRNDIYALGAVWFRMSCGRSPHGAGIDSIINASELTPEAKPLLRSCLGPLDARPSAFELLQKLRVLWKKRPIK